MSRFWAWVFVLLIAADVARALSLEGEGVTLLEGARSRETLRDLAVRDALANLAQDASSQLIHLENPSGEVLHQAAAPGPLRYTLLKEWEADGLYFVRVRAEFSEPGGGCGLGRPRKKITATNFVVVDPAHVSDFTDIWNAYPLHLLGRMRTSGNFHVINPARGFQLNGLSHIPDSTRNQEIVRQIAEQTGAQFVISGLVLDTSPQGLRPQAYLGSRPGDSTRRSEFTLPLNLLSGGVRNVPSKRHFDVLIFLFDGLTGALIQQWRYQEQAEGNVMYDSHPPFATSAFFAGDYGAVVQNVVERQVQDLSRELSCLPFAASIVRVEGKKAVVDAGSLSGLSPGDRFTLYLRDPSRAVQMLITGDELGVPERAVPSLVLRAVQPQFSVAEIEGEHPVKIGDLIRFELPPPEAY